MTLQVPTPSLPPRPAMTPAVVWRGFTGFCLVGQRHRDHDWFTCRRLSAGAPHPHSARQAGRLYVGFVVGLIPVCGPRRR